MIEYEYNLFAYIFICFLCVYFRVNDMGTRLTGALCGLGCDENGDAYFPENDMEVTFDTSFSLEEIKSVS